jgi:drug/metabolite transporter (DMT)-like permease
VTPSGTAGLGLLSAASWGGSDFIGGLGARRVPVLLVVASGHFVTLLVLLAVCLGTHLVLPGKPDLLFSAIGGFEGAIALALFYRALAMGAMGLTAALTGLLTTLVPVAFSLIHDGLPGPLTFAGLALGLAAIWLITHSPSAPGNGTPPAALLLGACAGLGFGAQLILFKFAAGGGILWILTSARAAGVTAMLLVLLVKPPKGPWRGFWLFGIVAGSLDTVGNLFYIQTTRLGRLDVAAMICSLYPAGTILLAALVLREWPTRRQFAGIALALGAVALLSI